MYFSCGYYFDFFGVFFITLKMFLLVFVCFDVHLFTLLCSFCNVRLKLYEFALA